MQSQSTLGVSETDAEEMMVPGRWLMNECRGAEPAVARLTRRLYKLDGNTGFKPLMGIIRATVPAAGLSDKQKDALEDIRRAFRIR